MFDPEEVYGDYLIVTVKDPVVLEKARAQVKEHYMDVIPEPYHTLVEEFEGDQEFRHAHTGEVVIRYVVGWNYVPKKLH